MRNDPAIADDFLDDPSINLTLLNTSAIVDQSTQLLQTHRDEQKRTLKHLMEVSASDSLRADCEEAIASYESFENKSFRHEQPTEEILLRQNAEFFDSTDASDVSTHALSDISEDIESLHEIDLSVTEKINVEAHPAASDAEKKAIQTLHHNAHTFAHTACEIGMIATLMIAGLALSVGTVGMGLPAGAALIMEGIGRMHELISHPEKSKQRDAMKELLADMHDMDEKNHFMFHEFWLKEIVTHCEAQKKSLAKIKENLQGKPDTQKIIEEIDVLITYYSTKEKEIELIKAVADKNERSVAIKALAEKIESTEKSASPTIQASQHALAEEEKHHADSWLNRAKHFYHNNKKMIQFAGLIALSALGIALSIATGGVAAALGAAALGIVGISTAKHFVKAATNQDFLHNKKPHDFKIKLHPADEVVVPLLEAHKKHIVDHCERQQRSITMIEDSLPKQNYGTIDEKFSAAKEDYAQQAHRCQRLHHEESESTQHQFSELKNISSCVEKTDAVVEKTLVMAGELPVAAAKESTRFLNRAKNFAKDNKEVAQHVGKFLLATTALTVLAVSTGGIGFMAAVGFAVMAFAISALAKKATEKLHAINQKNAAHEDEKDGEKSGKQEGAKTETKPSLHH